MYSSSQQQSFTDLLSIAQKNAAVAKKKAAYTQLLPETGRPKKADPKQSKLKEGVLKFLAKREEEDKRKKELEKVKKEKLLQLRNQDRKAANRVRKMLSMTKSANKSCMDDSKDCLNASVAAQGEFQPDEDDYGYTSNYADMMHQKMMEKYKAIPIKPTFPESSKAPVPKHQSLSSKNGTGWRGKNGASADDQGYSSPEPDNHEDKPKSQPSSHKSKPEKLKKKNRPPPPDYRQLLQLAEQKKMEPAIPIKPIVEPKDREEYEFGRPMTAKEKKQFLADKELKDRLARRMADLPPSDKNNNNGSSSDNKPGKMPSFKIPKANSNKQEAPPAAQQDKASPPKKPRLADTEPSRQSKESPKLFSALEAASTKPSSKPPNGIRPAPSKPSASRPVEKSVPKPNRELPAVTSSNNSPTPSSKSKGQTPVKTPDPRTERLVQERKEIIKERPRYLAAFEGKSVERERDRDRNSNPKKQPLLSTDSNKPKPGSSSREDSRDKPRGIKLPQDDRGRQMKSRDPRETDMRPPARRGIDMGRDRRDMGMGPQYGRQPSRMPRDDDSPPRMRPGSKPFKGRAVIDSDDEYDSEMDDFIDDSEMDLGNISAEISKIFKYDRRKYMYDESDDECMESSVAQQMREEQQSLRAGIKEDLEDIAREEAEKRQMKLMKMKMKKKR